MARVTGRQHSEYGGGEGDPQRRKDGSAVELTPGERARVMRIAAAEGNFNPAEADISDGKRESRARLSEKTNGYGLESSIGDES